MVSHCGRHMPGVCNVPVIEFSGRKAPRTLSDTQLVEQKTQHVGLLRQILAQRRADAVAANCRWS